MSSTSSRSSAKAEWARSTAHATFKIGESAAFDLTADGQRFLVNRAISESDPPVTVIVNWTKLLVH